MYELTSANDGPKYFNCKLQMHKDNLAMNDYEIGSEKRLESDDHYSFTWQVLRTDTLEQIVFAFKFKNPWLISKYAKDKMIIEFLKPDEFSAS